MKGLRISKTYTNVLHERPRGRSASSEFTAASAAEATACVSLICEALCGANPVYSPQPRATPFSRGSVWEPGWCGGNASARFLVGAATHKE